VKVLITGATGFVGRRLAARLVEDGAEVAGTYLGVEGAAGEELAALGVTLHPLDVRDAQSVKALVERVRPSVLYHLAARAHVPTANADPGGTLAVNTFGSATLAQAFGQVGGDVFVFASSALVYGRPDCAVVNEDHPRRPKKAYAVSKLAAEALIAEAALAYGFREVRLRLFNHTGPGQPPGFVIPDLAQRLSAAAAAARATGDAPRPIRVGNVDVRRDFSDVGDIIEAYRLAATTPSCSGAYNVGRGKAASIQDVLEHLAEAMEVPPAYEVAPELVREGEPEEVRADISRFTAATGWEPRTPLEDTLARVARAALEAAD
jgi:GDP-4-dehydro-6-deoxy-D-mannose reductase